MKGFEEIMKRKGDKNKIKKENL